MSFESKKLNDKCRRQKTWSCVVLKWSMTVGGCHGGGTKVSWSGFCSVGTLQLDFVVDLFGLWVCSGQCNWRVCLCGIGWLCNEKQSDRLGASIEMDCPILGLCVLCMFFSAVISPEHWENVFSTNCNGPVWFTLKTTLGKYLYWTWNPTNLLQSTFGVNLSELRYPFWVDYYLTYLTTNKFYDQPMFESRNICDLGLLQNARTHGPRGAVKTIEKLILQRTQVHYFCSGNSLQDPFTLT